MGLLNHIFGNRESVAKELLMDNEKRMALWKQHLANYKKREALCRHFNFGNINNALQNFDATIKVLNEIESLISPELVHIRDEEKLDHEIEADLNRLKSSEDYYNLAREIVDSVQKQEQLIALFNEIFIVLKTELHLIKLVRKRPSNAKELLLQLFRVMNSKEAVLYNIFDKDKYNFAEFDYKSIADISRSIILQEELKKELETDEEKFAEKMKIIEKMQPTDSETTGNYRKLGEQIFYVLTGVPDGLLKGLDVIKTLKKVEKDMLNNWLMYAVVKKLRPKYDDVKIKAVIIAFRRAYNLGHFEDMEQDFF